MEAVKVKNQEQPLFDETMRAKIIEREKAIEENPNDWIDCNESVKEFYSDFLFDKCFEF